MSTDLAAFYGACPGVVIDRAIEAALAALPNGSSAAAIQAAVLPLMPEGNPPQYTPGAPPEPPLLQPGGSPVFAAQLPPQPDSEIPVDGAGAPAYTDAPPPPWGNVAIFAQGLPRFADSNPDPMDNWSIEVEEALDSPVAGGW